jgi:hypothetical protein
MLPKHWQEQAHRWSKLSSLSKFNNLGQALTNEDGSKISSSRIVSYDDTKQTGGGEAKSPQRVWDKYKSATSIMRVTV